MKMPIVDSIHSDPSPTLEINERVRERWLNGDTVYHLGFGESRFPVHPKLREAIAANAHQKRYLPIQGLAVLREAIAAYYSRFLSRTASAEQVIVGPGSKSLIFALQLALNADLMIPTPSWVSYTRQAQMLGRPAVQIHGSPDSYFALEIDAVDAAVKKSTRDYQLLILNSPNNPTGLMYSAEKLQEIADYCRHRNIIVVSDEIYGMLSHGIQPHVTLHTFYPEGTIICGGLSKHLSLGGWRLGMAILPAGSKELMQALISIGSEIWSSSSAPIQYAAVTAYSRDPDIEGYIKECADIHSLRTQHIWICLNDLGVRCPQPQGGFYMMPDFNRYRKGLMKEGVETSIELAHLLLEEYHVASLPGTVFGLPGEQLALRLSTSYLDMETDEAADKLLSAYRCAENYEAFLEDYHPMMAEVLNQFKLLLGAIG